MATNPAVPFWDEGTAITGQASAPVTGKRFVRVSGPRVGEQVRIAHAGAGTRALGVSAHDAAVDQLVTVYSAPGLVMPVRANGAITAGDLVEIAGAGANAGSVATLAAGVAVGKALDDAAAGADAVIKLL
jgi:hypothetical protein